MKPEDYDTDEIEVWDENAESFNLFTQLMTQWRTGFNGPTGLDYTAVLTVINMEQRSNVDELFTDIRAMEHAALEQMAENRESD